MSIRGYVDSVRDNQIFGWAAAIDGVSGESSRIAVEALISGKTVARARADQFRQDLKQAGLGTGCHGFEIRLPGYLRSGGPFLVQVSAAIAGVSFDLGQVVLLRGEAANPAGSLDTPLPPDPLDIPPPPHDADLDVVLMHVRSVSLQVVLTHAEEVRAELGNIALVAYLFGRLLERMPDPEAYETYGAALAMGVLDAKGLMAEILQSEEYRSR